MKFQDILNQVKAKLTQDNLRMAAAIAVIGYVVSRNKEDVIEPRVEMVRFEEPRAGLVVEEEPRAGLVVEEEPRAGLVVEEEPVVEEEIIRRANRGLGAGRIGGLFFLGASMFTALQSGFMGTNQNQAPWLNMDNEAGTACPDFLASMPELIAPTATAKPDADKLVKKSLGF